MESASWPSLLTVFNPGCWVRFLAMAEVFIYHLVTGSGSGGGKTVGFVVEPSKIFSEGDVPLKLKEEEK